MPNRNDKIHSESSNRRSNQVINRELNSPIEEYQEEIRRLWVTIFVDRYTRQIRWRSE